MSIKAYQGAVESLGSNETSPRVYQQAVEALGGSGSTSPRVYQEVVEVLYAYVNFPQLYQTVVEVLDNVDTTARVYQPAIEVIGRQVQAASATYTPMIIEQVPDTATLLQSKKVPWAHKSRTLNRPGWLGGNTRIDSTRQ